MLRWKYISKADIESRELYNFFETLQVFVDPEDEEQKRYRDVDNFQHSIMQSV